jgi:aryl-alcohol dehydrogenase-like predicted oxidoreductase
LFIGVKSPADSLKEIEMEKRTLGNTGEQLSAVAFGGIVVSGLDLDSAQTYVDEAIDAGINYFDVAPSYGDAETRLGPALVGKRDGVFLACKTTERTREGSQRELDQSLENLKTDRFDLYQIHGITSLEDVETVFAPDGAMETLLRARDEGKTRYLGFSAHTEEAALAMMDGFDFDTILFPTNYVCWFEGAFGPRVIECATEKGMGKLALKAMARERWPESADKSVYPNCWYQPEDDEYFAHLALRFAWTQGITACVPPGNPSMWQMAVRLTEQGTEPLNESELSELRARALGREPVFSSGVMA